MFFGNGSTTKKLCDTNSGCTLFAKLPLATVLAISVPDEDYQQASQGNGQVAFTKCIRSEHSTDQRDH